MPGSVIAVSQGDPAGVGPEICLRLMHENLRTRMCRLLVFGDASVLRTASRKLGLPLDAKVGNKTDHLVPGTSAIVHVEGLAEEFVPGEITGSTGRAASLYLQAAFDVVQAGMANALVTGPIHKEAFSLAGVPFKGHTDFLASKTSTDHPCMMLTSDEITCSLVTDHIGLRDVPGALKREGVLNAIRLSHQSMQRLRGRDPQLTVCGLNPHAGEGGLFGGQEEERVIRPAVEEARMRGIRILGPLPPDTAFLPKYRRVTDCYVCMYHDQGLIPLKALAFGGAVNVTLGLPIVRTSVDHGTALDIAWKGVASAQSLINAVRLAIQLSREPDDLESLSETAD